MPLYIRRPTSVEIVEAEEVGPGAHSYPQGTRPARPGDWIVTNHGTGETRVLTATEFTQQYEPAAVPSSLLAPAQEPSVPAMATATYADGTTITGSEPLPDTNWAGSPRTDGSASDWRPYATRPTPPPPGETGDVEPFFPSGPATPMNESLPGRPIPTPDVEPRTQQPGPVETITGQAGPKEEIQPPESPLNETPAETPSPPEKSSDVEPEQV